MTEVMFYHLESQDLDGVLPLLLEKTLQRGWRAVVEAASEERVEALSSALWTYREETFLPHGTARDGNGPMQSVWLTAEPGDAPNEPQVRFFVDGCPPNGIDGLTRAVVVFNGRDENELAAARAQWKAVKAAGHEATYWRQDAQGRWTKMDV